MNCRGPVTLAILAVAFVVVGCTDAGPTDTGTTAGSSPQTDVEALRPDTAYEQILATFAARGATGAREAWDAEKPALLLFAASW